MSWGIVFSGCPSYTPFPPTLLKAILHKHLDINSQNLCTYFYLKHWLVFGHESKHEVTKQICHYSRTNMLILSYTVLNLLYLLSNFFGGSLNLDFWPFQDYQPNGVTQRALSSPSVSNSEWTSECGPDRASPWHDHRLHSIFRVVGLFIRAFAQEQHFLIFFVRPY